ncbi:hypothetical protein ACFWOL_33615 [Streptomyces sp. NPDC058442]|uniref:hypothetical protein n=1 Tax=Streptomyces sp. NPDC058442 TaxID=3346503 RepID=UPI00364D26A8
MLLATLTACGGDGDAAAKSKPSVAKTAGKDRSVDCIDESIGQAEWMEHCADEDGTGGDGTAGTETLEFGETAKTAGDQNPADGSQGGEMLEVTPTTVAYQAEAMASESMNGTFAIITVKDRAPQGTATESAPIEGGGWQWIAPDGQALDEGDNDASSITPNGFTGGGMVLAGAWAWKTIAFDIAEEQRGGTIVYTDGAGATYRWKVPAQDAGPELAKLKKGMEGNY